MKNSMILFAVVLALSAPQISYSQSNLSSEDLKYIKEMKEKHLWPDKLKEENVTPEKLIEIKKIIKEMEAYIKAKQEMETRKPLTDNELAQLDSLLRSKWRSMKRALAKGDIDLAVSFFTDSTKESFKRIFSTLSPVKCKQLARDLGDIQLIRERGYSVEYDLRKKINGKVYSFPLIFEKNYDGEWKISRF